MNFEPDGKITTDIIFDFFVCRQYIWPDNRSNFHLTSVEADVWLDKDYIES